MFLRKIVIIRNVVKQEKERRKISVGRSNTAKGSVQYSNPEESYPLS